MSSEECALCRTSIANNPHLELLYSKCCGASVCVRYLSTRFPRMARDSGTFFLIAPLSTRILCLQIHLSCTKCLASKFEKKVILKCPDSDCSHECKRDDFSRQTYDQQKTAEMAVARRHVAHVYVKYHSYEFLSSPCSNHYIDSVFTRDYSTRAATISPALLLNPTKNLIYISKNSRT